jgi:signal transduction histidine kinase
LLQTALIAGLLVQAARRRRAEAQVRQGESRLRISHDQIRDLGRRLLTAQEAERSRIARDLHDDVGQQLAMLAIDLLALGRAPQTNAATLVRGALARARHAANSVHALSHRLHPAKLRLVGLVPALSSLQSELSQADFTITFVHEGVPDRLAPDLSLCVFRVVQEAVQNTIKHSGAHSVSVELRGGPDALALTVADDGVGFDATGDWGKGLGLVSIRERLELVGGTLTIHSKPGGGTRLEITVPLNGGHAALATA